jgi:hypothetical protein
MDMTCELRAVARLTHLLSPLPHKSHELYTGAIRFSSTITSTFLLKGAPSLSNRPRRESTLTTIPISIYFQWCGYRGSFAEIILPIRILTLLRNGPLSFFLPQRKSLSPMVATTKKKKLSQRKGKLKAANLCSVLEFPKYKEDRNDHNHGI